MLTYTGGHTVEKETHRHGAGGAVVAGEGTAPYARMSSAAALLWGPAAGFLYTMVMPVIGIATVSVLSTRMVLGTLYHLAVKSVSCGWRPQKAYLSGRKKTAVTKK